MRSDCLPELQESEDGDDDVGGVQQIDPFFVFAGVINHIEWASRRMDHEDLRGVSRSERVRWRGCYWPNNIDRTPSGTFA